METGQAQRAEDRKPVVVQGTVPETINPGSPSRVRVAEAVSDLGSGAGVVLAGVGAVAVALEASAVEAAVSDSGAETTKTKLQQRTGAG